MARIKIELAAKTTATTTLKLTAGADSVPVDDILLRKVSDTRGLSASHVVLLAESIAVLGLLEPIVIDQAGHLLAGAHRLAALQLLTITDPEKRILAFLERAGHPPTEGKELPSEVAALVERLKAVKTDGLASRYPKSVIPVVVVDVGGKDGKGLPLAIEAAENTVRRQYSADEVKALADRFKEAGYISSTGGRPEKDQKTVMDALEASLGRSKRQIQRILAPTKAKRGKTDWDKAVAGLGRFAERVMEAGAKKEGEAENAVMALAEKTLKAVEKLAAG